jgi:aspartate carbamoyltransferase catalytic subunit
MGTSFFNKDLISTKDMTKQEIEAVLSESAKMLDFLQKGKKLDYLQNNILATLFYEPSTRTRLSFESAMQRLGGGVIGFADPASSSAMKGESLEDTIKVVSSYADVIVIRHNQEGAAKKAAEISDVPIINAGDGVGQHPTQALLDLFTIKKEKGKDEKLKIAIVGDLKNGRTVHSLAYVLALFGNDITFIAPEALQIPNAILDDLNKRYGNHMEKSESLEEALDADVIYMTRIQKERFLDHNEYSNFANYYTVNSDFLKKANDGVIIMHPLPRLSEISPGIDKMKNSVYFKQASYGVPVRMAILNMILNGADATKK